MTENRQSYRCLWRTRSDYAPSTNGDVTVQARSLIDAIEVAKQRVYEQNHIGTKYIVVYEVEEPFL